MARQTDRRFVTVVAALLLLAAAGARPAVAADDVRLLVNDTPAVAGDSKVADVKSLVLSNGLLTLTFGRDVNGDFSATRVVAFGKELAGNLHGVEPRDVDAKRTFYLDAGAGKQHLVVDTVRVLKNTPELAHFAVIDSRSVHLEHHFVMLRGESGVHPYVIIKTPNGGGGGEMRTMYRFDMDVLDHAWTNERTGRQPKYALLQSISEKGNLGDETWRLPDGSVYQKYDYATYFSTTPMFGHYGNGYGAWFVPVSTESYAGGPLRQELMVHQDALILNYIGGGHFSGGGTAAGRGGEKIHGPWFLYFNHADTSDALIADARKAAAAETAKWPYAWVDEPLYPLRRTKVTGQLHVSHGRPAAFAQIVLGKPGGDRRPAPTTAGSAVADRAAELYTQAGDYIYATHADADGKFTLPHVRPGTYTLYAWQTQGAIAQSFARDNVEINGDTLDLGRVEWDAPYHAHPLFQIGQPDRTAGEFKLGSAPRSNQLIKQVPADLTFSVGKSRDDDDWYFAQPPGTWTVKFKTDQTLAGDAHLTISVAGGGANVDVAVNGTPVGTLSYRDDASVRRAANRSGRYGRNEITFAASLLKPGENTLTLHARDGGGIMYDAIVMEAD